MKRIDNAPIKQRLEAVRDGLRRLDALSQPDAGTLDAAQVRATVTAALSDVDEAARLLTGAEDPPEATRVRCPFCQNMIMPTATLCSFCWRKLAPAATG